jgi:hypothetical protein
MKQSTLFIIFVLGLLSAANGQSINDLPGNWIIDINETLNAMTSTEKTTYNNLPAKAKQNLQAAFGGRIFSFNADGHIQIKFNTTNNSKTVSGTWSMDQEILVIQIEQVNTRYTITWYNQNILILRPIDVVDKEVLKLLYLKQN